MNKLPDYQEGFERVVCGGGFELEKADKELFAVYQTIYSDADVEMWFDFKQRLGDTQWTDNCYFLLFGGQKVGGALLFRNSFLYPFLIPPYTDRPRFLSLITRVLSQWTDNGSVLASDMLPWDAEILLTMGYKVERMRRVMIRPTDSFDVAWPDGYAARTPTLDDVPAIAAVFQKAFAGGAHWAAFGAQTPEEIAADAKSGLECYLGSSSIHVSSIVTGLATGEVAGACIAGVDSSSPNRFSGIYDVAVDPAHQGRGLASMMIRHALNEARPLSPAMKLCVTVGNSAESLYRNLGFQPGVKFTRMRLAL